MTPRGSTFTFLGVRVLTSHNQLMRLGLQCFDHLSLLGRAVGSNLGLEVCRVEGEEGIRVFLPLLSSCTEHMSTKLEALRPRVPRLKEKKAEGEREGVQRGGVSGQTPPLTRCRSLRSQGAAPRVFLLALGVSFWLWGVHLPKQKPKKD